MTLGLVNENFLHYFCPLGTVATGLILQNGPQLPKADGSGGNLRQVDGESVGDVLLYEECYYHKEVRLHERDQHLAEMGRCEFVAILADFSRMSFLHPLAQLPRREAIGQDKQGADENVRKCGLQNSQNCSE